MNITLKKLDMSHIEMVKALFADVFTNEPWNDDWSDQQQLHRYLIDLMGNPNSLTLGCFEDELFVGLSMGHIKHWYTGTEYFIDELCIARNCQGKGVGALFLKEMEKLLLEDEITQIFLLTDRNVPAYHFYRKNGFYQLMDNVSFAKKIKGN